MSTNTDPLFNKNSYVSFDATSLKALVVDRLNSGQIFTDQNYQGSNLSAFLDVISYSFSTLLYYLNKTSSESMFSESQIYENMNRIVKLLNYSPKGKITQSLAYSLSATNALTQNNYIIPRYSYVNVGGTNFSFNKDINFTNTANNEIQLQNPSSDLFLYQGNFQEYPSYNAVGNNNEVLFLNLGTTTYIDHFNIHVYVKSVDTGKWEQWQQTENLFLNTATDKVFEVRYNPNKNYEIKFGDDINGKKLKTNDEIVVYYLNIDPNALTVAANSLITSTIASYNSINYNQIQNDTVNQYSSIMNNTQLNYLLLDNQYPSNLYTDEESVDDIRKNAPKNFSYQQRLVTTSDFESYIKNNYSNIFSDVYVVNNNDYMKGHVKYLYDIGINSPQLDNRLLFNQIKFSTSCNFNNVYVYLVPKNNSQRYISSSQKELILSELESKKVLTSEVVTNDPIYMGLDFYVKSSIKNPNIYDIDNSKLLIYKKPNSRRASSGILSDIVNLITNTFNKQNLSLGYFLDINQLSTNILAIDGIDKIKTYRSDENLYIDGISLLVWNETYPNLDINVYVQNLQLQYFQYPLFRSINNLISRISIVEPSGIIQITDF
jgi:hypothetical protein